MDVRESLLSGQTNAATTTGAYLSLTQFSTITTEQINLVTETKEEEESALQNLGGLWRLTRVYGKGYGGIYFLAFVGAFLNGCTMPFFGALFREIVNALYGDNIVDEAFRVMLYFFAMAVGTLLFTTTQYGLWGIYGNKVGIAARKDYYQLLLRQEIGYHDTRNSGTLNTEMIANCYAITTAMGIKTGFFIQQTVTFVVGFGLAFWYSWEMSLVLIATMPLLCCIGLLQGKLFMSSGEKADPFVRPGSFSNEVFLNVRSVVASPNLMFAKIAEYSSLLDIAFPIARKRAAVIGFGIGTLLMAMFGGMYSVGLWYGSQLVDDKTIDVGDMFGCFFSFLIAGMALGQVGSVLEDLQKCQIAAKKLFNLQIREPKMRAPSIREPINQPSKRLRGKIEFKDVCFAYPSARERIVLDRVSFTVEPGKTLAIVGPSGGGKSTIVALAERFYDALRGDISFDGQPIHNFDPRYLRSQIGYVSQLPLLFAESIEDNIRGGNQALTREEIYTAAQFADAHEFIMKLPGKYQSNVGQMGGKLSGGQKQRIAIARAIVNRPCILLLDEATSALDTKSEREVQRALDKITLTKQQTIIVIAHRLSTIKNADEIIVIVDGEISERGTHQSLIEQNAVYAALVRQQRLTDPAHNGDGNDNGNDAGAGAGDGGGLVTTLVSAVATAAMTVEAEANMDANESAGDPNSNAGNADDTNDDIIAEEEEQS